MKKQFIQFFRLFALLMCFCTSLWVSAQSTTVTGTVLDETGDPMIGATVSVQEVANLATATDFDGNFSLVLPSQQATLTVTFIGYKPATQKVKGGVAIQSKCNPTRTSSTRLS